MTNSSESYFSFDELFFSKTDKRGIIRSGNSVFQRVSELAWDQLKDKPHNVIRHPDMPKGVFHLLWENLKADKPLGAFVKNRSKSGKHYWVFALAMPVQDGYLSVRIKPGGELLKVIEKEYAALRAKELSSKISPQESQELLLVRLQEMGFANYTSFMTHALFNQIENRNREQKVPVTEAMLLTGKMQQEFKHILESTQSIMRAYKTTKFIPLNLEIQSSAFGENGKQLSVVANQYQKMVGEINQEMNTFESKAQNIVQKLEMGQFYIGASQLMEDVIRYLQSENSEMDIGDDIRDLGFLSDFYIERSQQGVKEIAEVLSRFKQTCESLQAMQAGLELVRLTGKMEIARLNNATSASDLIGELRTFQAKLSEGLNQILDHQKKMSRDAVELSEVLGAKSKKQRLELG